MSDQQSGKVSSNEQRPLTIGVIGGGPGGLAAAARLAEHGVSVHLFEASAELGGLARSIQLWGKPMELSAHIFRTQDDYINSLWNECSGDQKKIPLRRGIYDGAHIVEYPMTPLRIIKKLGVLETLRSVVGIIIGRLSKLRNSEPKNAQDWMIQTYGKPLHDRFLRSYAEKLWGVPCTEIHARFPQFLFQSAGDSKQGEQSFLYPSAGNSYVWHNLGKKLENSGVTIHRKSRVSQLVLDDKKITGLIADDKHFELDHVISTMPLGLLGRLTLGDNEAVMNAASVLKARSTVLIYLQSQCKSESQFNWLSIYPDDYQMGRVTDFGHWLESSDDKTVFCLEYWCDREDALWNQSDEALVELATKELNKTQLVGTVSVLNSFVLRLPNTHPVFSLESQSAIDTLNQALASIAGLSSVGRHGSHGVLGMGESMEAARKLADRIVTDE